MKLHAKSVMAAVATVAITASTLMLGASSASAAAIPPYEPDAYSLGSLSLYDATGNVVTGGSLSDSPIVKYAVASGTTADSGTTKFAHLALATPDGTTLTNNWVPDQLGADTNYPVSGSGVPAVVSGAGATTPVSTGSAGDLSLAAHIASFPNAQPSSSAYYNLYQLRLYTPSTSAMTPAAKYFSVDILVTGSTWSLVYPAPKTPTSVSAVTANPVSPADHGSTVTLSATVTPANTPGTVTWSDGTTALTGGTYTASSGAASITLTPADGAHSYTAQFTPTDPTSFVGATSPALAYTVNTVGSVAVGLSVNPTSGPAYASATLTATVTPTPAGNPTGTMQFFDGSTPLGNGTASGNVYTLTKSAGFAQGGHSFTATFTPSNPAAWGPASTSAAVVATYDAPACTTCTDPQTLQVTVDPGTLTISTPYTPTNPFNLGHMTLASDGTHLSAAAAFGNATNPANGITITDTRAGDQQWTASVASTDFSYGTHTINAQNLSFTGVTPNYISGNALNATTKPVLPANVTTSTLNGYAAGIVGHDGLATDSTVAAHTFATAAHGVGTVYVDGVMNLVAPTSTVAGLYTATVTFTIA